MAVFQFLPADSLEIYLHAHRPFAYGETEKKLIREPFHRPCDTFPISLSAKKCYRKFYERFSEYANVPIFAEVFFLIIFSLIISIAILILTTGFTCDRKEH